MTIPIPLGLPALSRDEAGAREVVLRSDVERLVHLLLGAIAAGLFYVAGLVSNGDEKLRFDIEHLFAGVLERAAEATSVAMQRCYRRRKSAHRWRRKQRRGGQPSTSVVEYGWVASPVKAGLRPPPPATDGLDTACHPAIVCHQAFDCKERLR